MPAANTPLGAGSPPHAPSASWRARIHSAACLIADLRSGRERMPRVPVQQFVEPLEHARDGPRPVPSLRRRRVRTRARRYRTAAGRARAVAWRPPSAAPRSAGPAAPVVDVQRRTTTGRRSVPAAGSGRSSQDHKPNSDNQIRVNTRLFLDAASAAHELGRAAMCGASGESPANRNATHASTVVDRSPGPPWKYRPGAVARCCERIQRARARSPRVSRMPRNSRISRSSASIVTLVPSPPFHQPSRLLLRPQQVTAASSAACTSPRSSARRGPVRARGCGSRSSCAPFHDVVEPAPISSPAGSGAAPAVCRLPLRPVAARRPASFSAQARPPPRSTSSAAVASSSSVGSRSRGQPVGEFAARRPAVLHGPGDRQSLLARPQVGEDRLAGHLGSPQIPSRSSTSWNARPTYAAVGRPARRSPPLARRPAPRRPPRWPTAAPRSCPGHLDAFGQAHVRDGSRNRRRRPGRGSDPRVARADQSGGAGMRRAGLQQHLVGQRQHRVAGQHRGRVTPLRPHGRPMPAGRRRGPSGRHGRVRSCVPVRPRPRRAARTRLVAACRARGQQGRQQERIDLPPLATTALPCSSHQPR